VSEASEKQAEGLFFRANERKSDSEAGAISLHPSQEENWSFDQFSS
jgi:hypothetical protein